MKILFLVPYPVNESPSQRFRFEQYFDVLRNAGYSVTVQSFLSARAWRILYQAGHRAEKFFSVLTGFMRRFVSAVSAIRYDCVFIHREAAPLGPPLFEWWLARVLRKRIIYDFDDAIWTTDQTNESQLVKALKWRSKVKSICRWSYKVSCGNQYLADFAKAFNANVVVNPTTIDTASIHPRNSSIKSAVKKSGRLVVGWTGSHSTLKYLAIIEKVLIRLELEYPHVDVMIIANLPPTIHLDRLIFNPWKRGTEIDDLLNIDIGIMPLPDDEWSKGKCGFKALQYMALGIATVASPVGVNVDIIKNGENGYLASNEKEWYESLSRLINDESLRARLGRKGKETVESTYSVTANLGTFLSLFPKL